MCPHPSNMQRIGLEFRISPDILAAIVTSPFDVVKTRLQSSLFREKTASVGIMGGGGGTVVVGAPRSSGLLYNFVETGHILRYGHGGALKTIRL